MTSSDAALVRSGRQNAIFAITLNRPRAINALTSEMFGLLRDALAAASAPTALGAAASELGGGTFTLPAPRAIYLSGAGERGFCGGGDIKEIVQDGREAILAAEYAVDLTIANSPVPVIAVMDGVTMGGGIGIGGHARIRIVTERSRLAMPEARIGIAPDVGGHLLLARAPGRLGEYLAVTAGEMTAGDAVALGFADHFVPSDRLDALFGALVAQPHDAPEDVVRAFAEPAPASPLAEVREWWEPLVDGELAAHPVADDPVAATMGLVAALERGDGARPDAARETARTIRGMCPTSVVVTLAQLHRTRAEALTLAQVLTDDLRVLTRLGNRPDFREGVRAQVIDKDRDPAWAPDTLETVDPAEIARILDPAPAPGETPLVLPGE